MGKKRSRESKKRQLKRQRLIRRQKGIRTKKWVEDQRRMTASGGAVSPTSPDQAPFSPPPPFSPPAPRPEHSVIRKDDRGIEYYKHEVRNLNKKIVEIRKEHKAQLERIRYTWKEKIYGEKTRAGKILKLSLISNNN